MALPPVVQSGRYIAVYDAAGNLKVMALPSGRGILQFDGTDVRFSTGADNDPVNLPALDEVEGGDVPHIVAVTAAGQIIRLKTEEGASGTYSLKSVGTVIKWIKDGDSETGGSLPTDGVGVLVRDKDGSTQFLGSLTDKGIYRINGDGTFDIVPDGVQGSVFQIGNNGPFWGGLGGSIAGATDSSGSGLERVKSNNQSATQIGIQCPGITAYDAGGQALKLTNVNVSISLTASAGPGGIDTGVLVNGKWYHMWIIANESDTKAIFSDSLGGPNLAANASTYTYWVYAGPFYVESSGVIRDYYQKGRTFWMKEQVWGNNLNIGTTFSAIVGSVNLNTILPVNVRSCSGAWGGSTNETEFRFTELASSLTGLNRKFGASSQNIPASFGNGFKFDYARFENQLIGDPTNPQLFWRGSAAVNGKRRITLDGFTI